MRTLDVAVDRLDVFSEPDSEAFATSQLASGDAVEVRKELSGGWLAIAPPSGSFHWVEEADVEPLRDGRLYVKSPKTLLRFGRDGLDRPGPPRRMLLEGMTLIPVNRPRLVVDEGRRRRSWRAVAAGGDEVRFVHASGLVDPKAVAARKTRPEPAVRKASHDEARPTAPASSRPRPGPVGRGDDLAKAAEEFEAIVRSSRQRDPVLGEVRGILSDVREAEDLNYDAEGLFQPTSQLVDGEKVFVLLDREGRVVTYVKAPAGVETKNLIGRPVGVRGKSRFNEALEFRLLDARDVEPLTAN
jgi:hypothetical protein